MADDRSDQELLDLAHRGSEEAAEALFRRWSDWCARLAMRLCGDAADADEVAQDALVHVLSRPERVVLAGKMSTLLYPVVRLRALNAVRARRRAGRIGPGGDAEAAGQIDTGPAADARALQEERLTDLHRRVGRLPAGQREVLLMRAVQGMSVAEVAAALGVPEGTVKSRMSAAVRAIGGGDAGGGGQDSEGG